MDEPRNPATSDADAAAGDAAPQTSKAITFEQVLLIMEQGAMDELRGLIRWSSNYTFLTSITHEAAQLPVIYKPQQGERPLWDFPDGTLCYRERAAFLISEALGWQIVPPTVLKEGPRGLGSAQFFIDHDPDFHYFEFDATLLPQLARVALFDAIVNNADRKGGHCIVDGQNHLWGIDHGICFHSMPKLRTVIWDFAGQNVPQSLLGDVAKLATKLRDPESALRKELATLLSEREIQALARRGDQLLQDQNYPLPGPGPNQPWPPV